MPIYEYRCPSCGDEFEKLQKISAPKPACPQCGFEDVKKKVSASAFVLKGSGWYKDHYGLKSSGPASTATPSKDAGGASSDSGAASSGGSESSPTPTPKSASSTAES